MLSVIVADAHDGKEEVVNQCWFLWHMWLAHGQLMLVDKWLYAEQSHQWTRLRAKGEVVT
jgi:hypothetical protein